MPGKNSDQLRKGRRGLPGHYYHLTSATRERIPVFRDFHAARCLINCMKREVTEQRLESIAWVVMPDHFHWLLKSIDGDIAGTMQRVKSRCSHLVGRRLWQAGYHDRALRKEEDLLTIARYIVANPVRAQLVTTVRDYPHWDAQFLASP